MKSSRNFFTALGLYYTMNYLVSLMRLPLIYKPYKLGSNYTTALSTVPGPKVPWVFQGMKVK
jgi:WS/DGAT C-terminal domain